MCKIPAIPVTQTIEKTITDIQSLAQGFDVVNANKLVTDLWNLEQKVSALRGFILDKVFRKA